MRATIPKAQRWLFWNVDLRRIDLARDADGIIARVVERGRLVDVKWLVGAYGLARLHAFFRAAAHVEVSDKTVAFWRAFFHAENEPWAKPPAWRKSNAAPWVTCES